MINKNELLEKLQKENDMWTAHYHQISSYLYNIMGICYRTGTEYEVGEKIINERDTLLLINQSYNEIEDDEQCLASIYNTVINTLGEDFIKELDQVGEDDAEKTLAKLTIPEALTEIGNVLNAKLNIDNEGLIAMRTIQWMMNIIENEKEND